MIAIAFLHGGRRDKGIDTFIFSGYPHLDECFRVAELLLPKLPLAHALRSNADVVNMGPFGETIAGDHRPAARVGQS